MKDYQYKFIDYAFNKKALKFGKFKLKSGRISPYFFNIGAFNNGLDLTFIGKIYATVLASYIKEFDVLFGLAYKGIPLSILTTVALSKYYNKCVSYCFNRKEIKNYGEGNMFVGCQPAGKIVLIDDVITAGTSINESMKIISSYKASIIGIIVALDRQEIGYKNSNSVQEIIQNYDCKFLSIINRENLICYLKEKNMIDFLIEINSYKKRYGL